MGTTAKMEIEVADSQMALQVRELPAEAATSLESVFMPYFRQAEEWKNKASKIVVKDASQVAEMKAAREARLALKGIRCEVENRRKQMKEESLRTGKAIDGLANVIKFLIVPIEEHLQAQEDFVAAQEAKRKQDLAEARGKELAQYDVDTQFYNLGELPQAGYDQLLENSRTAWQVRKDAERKAEEDRIAREKAEAEERERVRVENERLKKEAEAREAEIKKEREAREKAEAQRIAKEKKEREAAIAKEREAREKAEEELKAKNDAIAREREAAEKARLERLEDERREKLAPDREKLAQLAVYITAIALPEVESEDARKILSDVTDRLNDVSAYIRKIVLTL